MRRTPRANYSGALLPIALLSVTRLSLALLLGAASAAHAQDAEAAPPSATGAAPVASPAPDADADAGKLGGWRLQDAASPYLRAHAADPVDWWPWGEAAFARARELSRPVLLSIGYSACHWCHRMQRDTFQDADVARLLNESFVCIKVDREQRPDIDSRYQQALQIVSGRGGWPATLFLTPDGAPFAGGTYLPAHDIPESRGLISVAGEVATLWKDQRDEVLKAGGELRDYLALDLLADPEEWDAAQVLGDATTAQASDLDSEVGGSHGAPKFPPSLQLQFLMRQHLRTGVTVMKLVRASLDGMEAGALHDPIGGGFHRYCVDDKWLLPHFEKMLADNALLAQTYAEAAAITGEPRYAALARSTLKWLADDLRLPEGLFCSARDADSLPYDAEGKPLPGAHAEEGLYYLWSPSELVSVLGEHDGAAFAQLYGVTEEGNLADGRSVLRPLGTTAAMAADPGLDLPRGDAFETWLAGCREKLAAARSRRPHPARDGKCVAAGNGLALTAFARTASLLGDEELLGLASRLAAAVQKHLLVVEAGSPDAGVVVHHQYFEGQSSGAGDLSDHAFVGRGLLDAYEATDEPVLLDLAVRTARAMQQRFEDTGPGGFFETDGGDPLLPGRGRELQDGAVAAGSSVAIELLARLAPLDDSGAFAASARRALARLAPLASKVPLGFPALLVAADVAHGPLVEIVIDGRGPEAAALLEVARRKLLPASLLIPNATAAAATSKALFADVPSLLEGRQVPVDEPGAASAWVCEKGACLLPCSTPEELAAQLAKFSKR